MFPYFNALGADFHTGAVGKRRPLEVGVFAVLPGGIELRRADAIRIAAGDNRSFIADWTGFCHTFLPQVALCYHILHNMQGTWK